MTTQSAASHQIQRFVIGIADLRCTCCVNDVLDAVRRLDGVESANLDNQRAELSVAYLPGLVDDEGVCNAVRERGYRCAGDPPRTETGRLALRVR
jgi:copper chaperone CopZ